MSCNLGKVCCILFVLPNLQLFFQLFLDSSLLSFLIPMQQAKTVSLLSFLSNHCLMMMLNLCKHISSVWSCSLAVSGGMTSIGHGSSYELKGTVSWSVFLWLLRTFFLKYFKRLHLLSVYVHACVEVRWWLLRAGSLILPCGTSSFYQGWTSGHQAW